MQFSQYAIVALAAMSMIGAAAGADDTPASHRASVVIPSDAAATATATTSRSGSSTMMLTVGGGDPAIVPTPRKLTKQSKAATACAVVSQTVQRLLRTLVFEKTMELYGSVQQPSSDAATAAAARADDPEERALQQVGHPGRQYHRKLETEKQREEWEREKEAIRNNFSRVVSDVAEHTAKLCQACLNFQWNLQDTTGNEQYAYCQNILNMMDPDSSESKYPDVDKDSMMNHCMEFFQCQTQDTRLACCKSRDLCFAIEPPDCSAGDVDQRLC